MEAENIKARFSFSIDYEGDLNFIYDFNKLKDLNIEKTDLYSTYLSVGSVIELDDRTYRIQEIKTKFYNRTYQMDKAPGEVWAIGAILDHNLDIIYILDEMK